ncbi:homocysteine S-methyltransferase family protein [Kiritimatiella glycovorans]|uniref:Bifunctional homocysteine S-methyltransferase/5,10-methylenetetrahydrofolate reductase n=1 Tax=Kiritimatiella glycovorans TaxID=1307763 RepID=A0A0G3EK13_9BACT|nr:homocysteine S-methyltransferase family protein [Kiritimatiella glycovorans]AKJ65130.1 Bifunctional homocysteine S-methyltransferase/5,10-methylenetetrahydrofolate reductase [Kiritimatiella glycovorans]
MTRPAIAETIRSGTRLVSDGAWGTLLQQRGLQAGECPEGWVLTRPDDVRDAGRAYIEAGADMIQANTFGGTRLKLAHYDLAEKAAEINERGAALSREAAGEDHWVIASMGPTGRMLLMGDITEEDMYEAFREQAVALERGGADAACVETMSDVQEAALAIRAVRENTALEIISTFTFEKSVQGEYRTMMGVAPAEAAQAALDAGAAVIGSNCGNGIAGMVEIVSSLRESYPEAPILIHANAGIPRTEGDRTIFPETPEEMGRQVPALLDAGASIIGGCCGTGPDHIRAVRAAVDSRSGQASEPEDCSS